MNQKTITMLRRHWKKVARGGGYFICTLNGFPRDKKAEPVLLVHPEKAINKQFVFRYDKDADLTKFAVGTVTPSRKGLWFNVDKSSKERNVMNLRNGLRKLAKDPQLKRLGLGVLMRAKTRKMPALELAGAAKLGTADQVRKKAGTEVDSRSAKKGQKQQEARYRKLLEVLDEWHRLVGGGLEPTERSVKRAVKKLDRIEKEAKIWLAKCKDTGQVKTRRKEIDGVRKKVLSARAQLEQFELKLQNSAIDNESDDYVDSLKGDLGVAGGAGGAERVQAARSSISRRLAEQGLNKAERAQLLESDEVASRALIEQMKGQDQGLEGPDKEILAEIGMALDQLASQPPDLRFEVSDKVYVERSTQLRSLQLKIRDGQEETVSSADQVKRHRENLAVALGKKNPRRFAKSLANYRAAVAQELVVQDELTALDPESPNAAGALAEREEMLTELSRAREDLRRKLVAQVGEANVLEEERLDSLMRKLVRQPSSQVVSRVKGKVQASQAGSVAAGTPSSV